MPLKRLPTTNIDELIKQNLYEEEDDFTKESMKLLSGAKKRKYLTKQDLISVCNWKSPRAIKHIKSNSNDNIIRITKQVFRTNYEKYKMELLCELKGVSVPMASSVLMLISPRKYGVIDIRVWQLLYKLGKVNRNNEGVNFTSKEWYRYLMILRYLAKRHKVSARFIEKTLFLIHRKYQRGNLYNKKNTA
jgi:hypothetical protein